MVKNETVETRAKQPERIQLKCEAGQSVSVWKKSCQEIKQNQGNQQK